MASASLSLASVLNLLRENDLLTELHGPVAGVVDGVSQDSRDLAAGDLFLAWGGTDYDAHDFLAEATHNGAVAAVVERFVPDAPIPQLEVNDGRRAAAIVADAFHGSPWQSLFTAGITGTNGKTTTAVLAAHLLGRREPAAAIGTLGLVDPDGRVRPGTEGLTTPGPVQLSGWLRELVAEGVRSVALEASSHALAQARLDGTRFDVAVFTNLSRDHLDYHKGQADYLRAKSRLLELLKPNATVVVNADDPAWQDLPGNGEDHLTFALRTDADLQATDTRLEATGSRFTLEWGAQKVRVKSPLLGGFNVENSLAAAAVALSAGISLQEVATGLGNVPPIDGRLEPVVGEPVPVIIDFAHTPDALRRVLETLRPLVQGRVIVVFGAGGDRDREKRPAMGLIVAELADLALVTSDNPRTEDPESIIDDIMAGMGEAHFERIPDRREAIGRALEMAEPDDVVILAGKGHERYQQVGSERLPFDEREVVREYLAAGQGV